MKADISTLHKPDILILRRQRWKPFITFRWATIGRIFFSTECG